MPYIVIAAANESSDDCCFSDRAVVLIKNYGRRPSGLCKVWRQGMNIHRRKTHRDWSRPNPCNADPYGRQLCHLAERTQVVVLIKAVLICVCVRVCCVCVNAPLISECLIRTLFERHGAAPRSLNAPLNCPRGITVKIVTVYPRFYPRFTAVVYNAIFV